MDGQGFGRVFDTYTKALFVAGLITGLILLGAIALIWRLVTDHVNVGVH